MDCGASYNFVKSKGIKYESVLISGNLRVGLICYIFVFLILLVSGKNMYMEQYEDHDFLDKYSNENEIVNAQNSS